MLATIPVGLSGLALEHLFRSTLGKPIPAAVFFLIVNGGILLGRERSRRRSAAPVNAVAADTDTPATPDGSGSMGIAADERPAQMSLAQEILIGCAQILALLPPEVPAKFLRHLALLAHAMRGHHTGNARRHDPPGPVR